MRRILSVAGLSTGDPWLCEPASRRGCLVVGSGERATDLNRQQHDQVEGAVVPSQGLRASAVTPRLRRPMKSSLRFPSRAEARDFTAEQLTLARDGHRTPRYVAPTPASPQRRSGSGPRGRATAPAARPSAAAVEEGPMPKRGRPDAPMQEAGAVTAPPTKVAADGAGEGAGGATPSPRRGTSVPSYRVPARPDPARSFDAMKARHERSAGVADVLVVDRPDGDDRARRL
jgi:hypothetical protein